MNAQTKIHVASIEKSTGALSEHNDFTARTILAAPIEFNTNSTKVAVYKNIQYHLDDGYPRTVDNQHTAVAKKPKYKVALRCHFKSP
jgi:hypothetical protein